MSGVFSVNTIVTAFGVKLKTIPKTVVVFLQAFLSASARSWRRNCPRLEADVAYFNSLQREAGDIYNVGTMLWDYISIHSSAKPETCVLYALCRVLPISIHSSAKQETAIITNFYLYPTHFLIQINQYFIFSTPFLHQSPYHNAPFPVRIP